MNNKKHNIKSKIKDILDQPSCLTPEQRKTVTDFEKLGKTKAILGLICTTTTSSG
ncbi:MAG: hypothetical protein LKK19_06235 [Bacteroidales bacterium]|nr:hypothetical protein [Bacteroidales bacterium]MCI2122284.1 hypothetical protein [Bacteroidales bacterium]MCI2145755.1 hypothetical protein [Bacteroidales bacterium]